MNELTINVSILTASNIIAVVEQSVNLVQVKNGYECMRGKYAIA